jgi:hypothetical protein
MQIRLHAMYGHSKSFYLWYQTTVLQHLRDADKQLIFVVSVLCIGELMSMASLSIAKCVLFFFRVVYLLLERPSSHYRLLDQQVPDLLWLVAFSAS